MASSWQLYFSNHISLPLPPFGGSYTHQPQRTASPTVVLLSREGTYFGQRPWPYGSMVEGGSRANTSCINGDETVLVLQINAASAAQIASAEAHVRVFHSPDWQSARAVAAARADSIHKPSRDVLVHYSRESPLMFPADLDVEYTSLFEMHSGYHRSRSTYWWPYIVNRGHDHWLRRLRHPQANVRWRDRNTSRLLITAVSNCADYAGRRQYLAALRRTLGDQFINLGSCIPSGGPSRPVLNRQVVDKDKGRNERAFISKGFFYLAIENANCEDYITEKLGRALLYGVVPVVFDAPQSLAGGPTVESGAPLIPGYSKALPPGSYINIADYPDAEALAAHLKHVASNATAYNAYLWPHRGARSLEELKQRWPQHVDLDKSGGVPRTTPYSPSERPECRLATAALRLRREAAARGTLMPRLAPDTGCLPPNQLCHFIRGPEGTCKPGGIGDRVRPVAVKKATKGNRYGSVK